MSKQKIILVAMLLGMAGNVNAQEPSRKSYTQSIAVPTDNIRVSRRPPVDERLFTSETIEKKITEVKKLLNGAPYLAWMFENCFPNTLDTTVHYSLTEDGEDDTFVYTGDIHAMWLRDSGAQVWPYVQFAKKDAAWLGAPYSGS